MAISGLSALKSIGGNLFSGKTLIEPKLAEQGKVTMYNFADGKYNLTHPRHGGYDGATKALHIDFCA